MKKFSNKEKWSKRIKKTNLKLNLIFRFLYFYIFIYNNNLNLMSLLNLGLIEKYISNNQIKKRDTNGKPFTDIVDVPYRYTCIYWLTFRRWINCILGNPTYETRLVYV